MPDIELTQDSLLDGQLVLWQPAKGAGYRFNLDPVLLSGFAPAHGLVVDLGSGCGVLGLLMLLRGAQRLIAVEREPVLASLIKRNAEANGLSDRVEVICGDIRKLDIPQADHVVVNPPYFKVGSGKPSPNPIKDAARFERHGGLEDFVRCALNSVGESGSASFVIRYDRKQDIIERVEAAGGGVRRLRSIRPHEGAEPKMLMAELVNGRASPLEMPPLTIHRKIGERDYVDEVNRLLGPV